MSYEELVKVEEEVYQVVKSTISPPGSKSMKDFLNNPFLSIPRLFEEKLLKSIEVGTITSVANEKGEKRCTLSPKGKRIRAFAYAFKEYVMRFIPEEIKEMILIDAQYLLFRAYSHDKRVPQNILKDTKFRNAYAKFLEK